MNKSFFITILFSFILFSCITREEVDATIWNNNFNDDTESMAGVCERNPEIRQYGFYRILNNGKVEFISVCNKIARNMLAIQKDDYNRILDKALPKKNASKFKQN